MARVELEINGKDKGASAALKGITGSIVKAQLAVEAFKIATKALVDVTTKSIQVASDYEESNSKLNTVFQGLGSEVDKAKESIKGLSEKAITDLLGNTGDLLTGEWDVTPQIRISETDENGFNEWQDLYFGSYTGKLIQFRLILESKNGTVNAVVTRFRITLDVPDRVIAGKDIIIPIGGLTIPIDPPYVNIPTVLSNGQNLNVGDRVNVSNKLFTQYIGRFPIKEILNYHNYLLSENTVFLSALVAPLLYASFVLVFYLSYYR